MKNVVNQRIIYIFGNGFDIAANLPTRYTDFMYLINHWGSFYDEYSFYFDKKAPNTFLPSPHNGKLTEQILHEYAKYRMLFNEENIQKIDTVFNQNLWVIYFRWCQYSEAGWAGFEKEIKQALQITDRLYRNNTYLPREKMSTHEKAVCAMIESKLLFSTCDALQFSIQGNDEEITNRRKKYIETLAKELLEFTEAFRLYLLEFVERIKTESKPGIVIDESTETYVISLNYTHNQYRKIGLDPKFIHMVHGSDEIQNNLVMGIENDESLSNEFIRFKKYFQRIQKKTGADYKKFFIGGANQFGNPIPYKVVFFGHSLDPIDADFIKDIFAQYPKTKIIHYCSPEDYEQKVINCVEIFGAEYVIDAVAKREIIFTDEDLNNIPSIET